MRLSTAWRSLHDGHSDTSIQTAVSTLRPGAAAPILPSGQTNSRRARYGVRLNTIHSSLKYASTL